MPDFMFGRTHCSIWVRKSVSAVRKFVARAYVVERRGAAKRQLGDRKNAGREFPGATYEEAEQAASEYLSARFGDRGTRLADPPDTRKVLSSMLVKPPLVRG